MNIHHASLFPDVIGASGYCNELISEFIASNKKITTLEVIEESDSIEAIVKIEPAVAEKDYVITETDDLIKNLIISLIVDSSIQGKVSEVNLKIIIKNAFDFIDQKAGVDWYMRESQLSRLNIIVRRNLKKIQFPQDFIDAASSSFVKKIAQFSAAKDREERLKKGSLIDLPKTDSLFKNLAAWNTQKD